MHAQLFACSLVLSSVLLLNEVQILCLGNGATCCELRTPTSINIVKIILHICVHRSALTETCLLDDSMLCGVDN